MRRNNNSESNVLNKVEDVTTQLEQEIEKTSDFDEIIKEDEEFELFFSNVLEMFPQDASKVVQETFTSSREKAEEIIASIQAIIDEIFEEFLKDVDEEKKKKAHNTIHFASLTSAIIGFSPVPFSDAILLVPVQIAMMSRLHVIFGQSWSESLGKSLAKELVVVSLGKSAVGNILKIFPAVGTVAGGMINATVAVILTEALGWVTVKMLNDGEDIFEQVMSFRGQFEMIINTIQGARSSK